VDIAEQDTSFEGPEAGIYVRDLFLGQVVGEAFQDDFAGPAVEVNVGVFCPGTDDHVESINTTISAAVALIAVVKLAP